MGWVGIGSDPIRIIAHASQPSLTRWSVVPFSADLTPAPLPRRTQQKPCPWRPRPSAGRWREARGQSGSIGSSECPGIVSYRIEWNGEWGMGNGESNHDHGHDSSHVSIRNSRSLARRSLPSRATRAGLTSRPRRSPTSAAMEALIFDCDGVILDSEDLHRRAYNLAFEYFQVSRGRRGWRWRWR